MTNGKYKQSKEDLEQHLKDIIEALELSSKAFDEGHIGEAKRLAASIRVLVHDTNLSKSLLDQLNLKNNKFYDTSLPTNKNISSTYNGLVGINLTNDEVKYIALLDELPPDNPPRWISFDEWWNKVIFIDTQGVETTRKDLVLAVANKDGGAHIDPVLDEKYANLSRRNSLAWRYTNSKGDFPMEGPENVSIRQMAHEILKTLDPEMPHMKFKAKGTIIFDVRIGKNDAQPKITRVGRNDQCPCGSGKKYKRCHGK